MFYYRDSKISYFFLVGTILVCISFFTRCTGLERGPWGLSFASDPRTSESTSRPNSGVWTSPAETRRTEVGDVSLDFRDRTSPRRGTKRGDDLGVRVPVPGLTLTLSTPLLSESYEASSTGTKIEGSTSVENPPRTTDLRRGTVSYSAGVSSGGTGVRVSPGQ